jgi:methylase of polypeptide subunit release factors
MTRVRGLVRKFGPDGGHRVVPVREFLAARWKGALAIERAFFTGLLMRNGLYKTTEVHRMDAVLPLLVEHARLLPETPLRVLDVGCSSGVTTIEMHRAFEDAGLAVETVGTDLTLFADYVTRENGAAMLFDSSGLLLQVELGDWASPWRWRPRDRVFRPFTVARAQALIEREGATFLRARHETIAGFESTRIALLSSLAQRSSHVRFCEEDILAPTVKGTFSLVRAANLLNPDHFTPAMLGRMIDALRARLVDGGLLLIVRSQGGSHPVHDGTLFRLHGDRFEVVARIGAGSEIASLVVPDSDGSRIPVQ